MGESGRSDGSGSRRVGDETRKRIDDLADGWGAPRAPRAADLDDGDTERVERDAPAEAPPPVAPRAKRVSQPPPIPPTRPRAAPAEIREDPTLRRDDPTGGPGEDATILQIDPPAAVAAPARGGRARMPVAVPRQRGVIGDMRYVFAALFGVARARAQLGQIGAQLAVERAERDRALIAVARYTVGNPRYDQLEVESAREGLAEIEERRSRHAGAVAAAEEEIAGLGRTRGAARDAFERDDQRRATELQAIATKLAPLEKAAAEVRKRVKDLEATAATLAKRIKSEEKKLLAGAKKDDPGAVEANLAGVRAEREAVLADEPALAAELDELEPTIAGLSAARAELEQQRATARTKDETDATRTAERIAAAEARKQVEDNAVADTDREREAALLALGERLAVDRPGDLAGKLGGAEQHEVVIATLERTHLELEELVEGVDRLAFARGAAYWLIALGAVAAIAFLVLTRG